MSLANAGNNIHGSAQQYREHVERDRSQNHKFAPDVIQAGEHGARVKRLARPRPQFCIMLSIESAAAAAAIIAVA